jgi:hypothetical protein
MPSFNTILRRIVNLWDTKRDELKAQVGEGSAGASSEVRVEVQGWIQVWLNMGPAENSHACVTLAVLCLQHALMSLRPCMCSHRCHRLLAGC